MKANIVDPSIDHSLQGLFDVCMRYIGFLVYADFEVIYLQYADVNAFLTLAATRHTFFTDDLRSNPKVNDIVTAAKAGRVPVHLVSSAFKLYLFPL